MEDSINVIVCCYGLWDQNRSAKELIGYGQYLRRCAEAIDDLKIKYKTINVAVCGGATNDHGVSEASTTILKLKCLIANTINIGKINFIVEDRSRSTPANLVEAEKIIKQLVCNFLPLVVIGDRAREIKLRFLINTMWPNCPGIELVTFERQDISWKSNKLVQRLEVLSFRIIPGRLKKSQNKTV